MKDDIYRSPSSEIKAGSVGVDSVFIGVLIGILFNIVVSVIASALSSFVFFVLILDSPESEQSFETELFDIGFLSFFSFVMTIIGLIVSLFAGRLSARYAQSNPYLAAGIVCVAYLSYSLFSLQIEVGTFGKLSVLLLNCLAVMVGAKVYLTRLKANR